MTNNYSERLDCVPVAQTIENPTDEQLFDRKVVSDITTLCCPTCAHEYSHVQAVYTLIGEDESRGMYRGSHLVARQTPYRRDALAVRVQGECGHIWDFVFQQHKGQTFIRIDVLKKEVGPGEELNLERV
jgi:hypothetical protein